MRSNQFSGASKFIAGVITGAVLFSGSAIALNNYVSDNTPENGYLLCANNKTKAVTFPNKLSCPSGTKALDLGAVTGVEGPEGPAGSDGSNGYNGLNGLTGPAGPTGPTGPAGSSSSGNLLYQRRTTEIDIVADGTYSTFASLKKVILSKISPNDLPLGFYRVSASISGLWADNVPDGRLFSCYFQYKKEYDVSGSYQMGSAKAENGSWTGISLYVTGGFAFTSSTDDPMYLVCAAGGTVKEVDALIKITKIESANLKNTLP